MVVLTVKTTPRTTSHTPHSNAPARTGSERGAVGAPQHGQTKATSAAGSSQPVSRP